MKTIAAAIVLAAFAGPAFADTIENGFGNTFVVRFGDGQSAQYYFEPDHTFMAMTGGSHTMGAWEVADGQLCLTPQGGERACSPYVGDKKVGDTWTQTGRDGAEISITLNAGR